jgi:hypothetical protein
MTPSQPRISASASHPRALSRTCYSYIVTNSYPRPMVEAVTHFYLTRASPLSQIILHTLASPYPHCPREALTISTFRTSPLYMFIALLPPDPVYPLAGEEAPGLTRVLCSATVDKPSHTIRAHHPTSKGMNVSHSIDTIKPSPGLSFDRDNQPYKTISKAPQADPATTAEPIMDTQGFPCMVSYQPFDSAWSPPQPRVD